MKKIIDCCKSSKKHKLCERKSDGKIFKLPRKFKKKRCLSKKDKIKGFTMRSSCAPYKNCKLRISNNRHSVRNNKNIIVNSKKI